MTTQKIQALLEVNEDQLSPIEWCIVIAYKNGEQDKAANAAELLHNYFPPVDSSTVWHPSTLIDLREILLSFVNLIERVVKITPSTSQIRKQWKEEMNSRKPGRDEFR